MDIVTYALLKKSKADLVDGKVPVSQLPSYIDEVIEVATKSDLPESGEKTKIYAVLDTNTTYRWADTVYVPIGNLAIPLTGTAAQVLVSTETPGEVAWSDVLTTKQDKLVSAENIKTINGQTLLGSGDLAAGLVDDIRVDNQSVVNNRVAEIDLASKLSAKQDNISDLEDIRTGAQLGATAIQEHQSLAEYRKSTTQDSIDEAQNQEIAKKQAIISDLDTIRAGALAGSTAVQPVAIADMATKTWTQEQGYLTQHQSLSEYAKSTEVAAQIAAESEQRIAQDQVLDSKIQLKQDILTAGQNIQIQNNVISSLDATIGRSFTTNVTVGHLATGTTIAATDTLKDLLYRILYGTTPPPVTSFFSQYKESEEVPSTIDASWTQAVIDPEQVKASGLTFTVTDQAPDLGFLSFAFNASLGKLSAIYQSGVEISILSNWKEPSLVKYNNIDYYMYVSPGGDDYIAQLKAGNVFTLVW